MGLDQNWLTLYSIQFITFLSYAGILIYLNLQNNFNFSKFNLGILVLFYSLIIIMLNNYVSYIYTDNFFIFSTADAYTYHLLAQSFNQKSSIIDAFESLSRIYGYDDFGAVFMVAMVYKIAESNLVLNVLYWITGVFSALGIFSVSNHFMSKKYAFLCAFSFSASSFMLWFHSSGLKESFMIFLVIQAYVNFYNYRKTTSVKSIIYIVLFLTLILFFRPAVSFLILTSFSLGILLVQKMSPIKIFSVSLIAIVFLSVLPLIVEQQNRYTSEGNIEDLLERKEADGMVKGSLQFTYFVNAMSSFLGPLPTFSNNVKQTISFYSYGLYFRVLTSFLFILSLFFIFKLKAYSLYPIMLFTLFEMASLILILESLELRKSLPHFPFIYILSFWAIYYINDILKKQDIKTYKSFVVMNNLALFLFLGLVFYWNFRF